MRRLLGVLLLIWSWGPCAAQADKAAVGYDVMVGKPFEPIQGRSACVVTSDERICLSLTGGKLITQRLDLATLEVGALLTRGDLPAGAVHEYFAPLGRRLLFFYSWWDEEAQMDRLEAKEVNKATGDLGEVAFSQSFSGRLRGYLSMTGFFKTQVLGKYHFISQASGDRIRIAFERKEHAGADRYTMLTLDSALNVAISHPISRCPRVEGERVLASEWSEDLEVVAFTRDKLPKSKGNGRRRERMYSYSMQRCSMGDSAWHRTDVIRGGLEVSSGLIYFGEDSVLQFAGWYRSPADWPREQGFLHFREGAPGGAVRLAIPDSMLLREPLPSQARKVKFGAAHVVDSTKQVVFRSVQLAGGRQLLLAEQWYWEEAVPEGERQPAMFTNTDDLFLCALDSAGRVLWTASIPRRQWRRGGVERTCHYVHYADRHHLLRFDRLANVLYPGQGQLATEGPRVLIDDHFDPVTGSHERSLISELDSWGIVGLQPPRPERMITIGPGRVLYLGATLDGHYLPVTITMKP